MNRTSTPLLLFFVSPRSGPCRRMESVLAQVGRKQRGRVRILRVDVEDQAVLAQHFRVGDVPSLVLVRDKRAVARLEGRVSGARIEALLDAHLPERTTAG